MRFLRCLTCDGLRSLAQGCPKLLELDVTHSLSDDSPADIAPVFACWPQMRKLFFGGSR